MTNKTIKFWKNFARKVWAEKLPPWKPSANEIKFWEKIVCRVAKSTKNPKALILGATPEFRDMFSKYPINVTLLDINPEMYVAMRSLMKCKPKYEKFVKSDWLKIPFKNETFDIIIGDTPHHNIKKRQYGEFFSEVRRVLKTKGYFLLSSWFFDKSNNGLTMRQYTELYRRNPQIFRDFKSRTLALYRLGKKEFYNRQTWEWDWHEIDEKITKEFKKYHLPKDNLKYIKFNYGNYVQVCPWEPDFSKFLAKFFNVLEIWQDKSYVAMSIKKDWVMKKYD